MIKAGPRPNCKVVGAHLLLSLDALLDLRGHDALLRASWIFAPREERHVHRNHAVGAVRLIEVDG